MHPQARLWFVFYCSCCAPWTCSLTVVVERWERCPSWRRTNRSAHGHKTTCWVTSSTQIVCEPSLLVVWSLHSYVLCIIKETFSCLKAALVTQAKVWFNLPKLKKLWIWETCPPEKIQRLFAHFLLAIIRRLVMMWKHFGVEQNIMELNHEVMETRLVVVCHALWLDISQL